jgi:two-component system, OmpR family, sensor histidine kinase KdpD
MLSEPTTERERKALDLLARERLRNSLLAAISHDLRTPLARLVSMAESLALTDGRLTGPHVELACNIRDAAARMNSQVNNLLDMMRLQPAQMELGCQWLPLEEVIGCALQSMEGLLDAHRVSTSIPSDLPLLYVEPVLFDRVLCNLLENAAKYTPVGSPIDISAEGTGDQVRIYIDDHGPGLAKHREQAVFRMFERDCSDDAVGGVGLGLAICRAIVEAHDGAITGESRSAGGARFTITLPLGEPPRLDLVGGEDGALAPS